MKLKISKLPYTVKIKTTRALEVCRLDYNATTLFAVASSVVNNTTASYSSLATDGTHFWIRSGVNSTIKYNGEDCAVRSGGYYMVTLPDNYDPSIPFDLNE